MVGSDRDALVTPSATLACVALRHGYRPADIRSPRRTLHLVRARRACAVALRRHGLSYAEVGRLLKRDHTSVLYLVRGERRHP